MSIGKSAINRVENNGYSKVKSDAPDMQNSLVLGAPDVQVVEKIIKPVEHKTVKKSTTKKISVSQKKDDFKKIYLGEDLPFYLL